MKFTQTPIEGAFLIEPEPHSDERGWFARSFCEKEFGDQGLNLQIKQTNLSQNHHRGTLRGMHFQRAPAAECKLVQCMRGSIYDVIVDLRADSLSYKAWHGVSLSQENGHQLYIPKDVAHGFITLVDDTVVQYQISKFYNADAGSGLRWDDPDIGILWPLDPVVISARDQGLPCLKELGEMF